ncbi:MAG: hypothetical protein ACFFBH_10225 [Promethearchaeota archaeon]
METKRKEINFLEKKQKLESLVKCIFTFKTERLRLKVLEKISVMNLRNYDLFPILKRLISEDPNTEMRILAIKILHKQYQKKCEHLVKVAIKNEDYFDIPIIVSGKSKRYNFNDLISFSIEKMKYGEIMVNKLLNTELLDFLLDWRQYRDIFHIYYDIRLECFILVYKASLKLGYLCSNYNDHFSHLKIENEDKIEEFSQDSILYIFANTFHTLKSEIRVVHLSQSKSEIYPTLKIIDEVSHISCYIE